MLSVVLPNFNHAPLLPRALDALLAQERRPDEILIVDDGSTDESRAIITRYAAIDTRIRPLLHAGNRGVLAALATGIDAARGRFLYLAAADDQVLPGFFAEGLALLALHPAAGLLCGEAVIVDGPTGAQRGFRPLVRPLARPGFLDAQAATRLFRRADFLLLTGSSLIRRDFVREMGGLDLAAGSLADSLLTRKIAFTHGLCYLPRPVAVWHRFDDSYSFSTALDAHRLARLLTEIPPKLAADPAFPSWYPAVFARRWRFACGKLIAMRAPIDRAALLAAAGPTRADRFVLLLLAPLTGIRAGRLLLLAWLALRFRTYRFRDVALTWLMRRREARAFPDHL
ncbi:MAG: glycosyltransferase family 2 protein [Rhodospirillaceae bacterium]|nr:glycosyltransferase family 2 protein [Rhodospirillaceae bacterium]